MPYRTDATNADTALTRNFIRAEVLPKLCRVNAQAVEHIGETALRLRQEDEFLNSLAAEALREMKAEDGMLTLPCAAVTQAHAVLRPRVLRLALDALGAGKKDFTAAHYDALAALCAGRPGQRSSTCRRRDRAAHGRRVDALRTPEGDDGARFAPRRGDRPVGWLCHHLPKMRKNG